MPCAAKFKTVGEFDVKPGQEIGFALCWSESFRTLPESMRAEESLPHVESFWKAWSSAFKPAGEWSEAVLRSLLTLKALAHWETGGIIAAGTTSLPEKLSGPRNWDYRYCWLRDATFTLYALIGSGFLDEARAWHEWLQRAIAGSPDDLQIMYGVGGERRLTEYTLPWLPGYEGAGPVRIGNLAAGQIQLDVYGEVLDAFFVARRAAAGCGGNKLGARNCAHQSSREDLGSAGRWNLGSARRAQTFHPFKGHGVGRL